MKDSATSTDDDRLLIGALQVAPRAPWSDIGQVLGVSAVTASRRWDRISAAGATSSPAFLNPKDRFLLEREVRSAPLST
jgi:DNA-binding Lrp family transcriptional regulator